MSARGFFAIGVVHGKTPQNIGTLLRSAQLYDAAFVFTVGRRYDKQASDTPRTPLHTPLFNFDNIDDLHAHLPFSCPLVGIELDDRAVPLADFTHPDRACYLLGAEDHGLTPTDLARCHHVVQIETAKPQSLNVSTAGSVVLYDRFVSMKANR